MNWRRPHNLTQVLSALRAQTVPLTIALVECSPGHPQFAAGPEALSLCDTAFSISTNIGPASRFLPPLAMPSTHEYTFFAVDDFVPGPRHVECLIRCAEDFRRRRVPFATIGQDGRRTTPDGLAGKRYRPVVGAAVPVDVICSSELCFTRTIMCASQFRQELIDEIEVRPDGVGRREGSDGEVLPDKVPLFEDDLLLCLGIGWRLKGVFGYCPSSFLAPQATDEQQAIDESWRMVRLDAPHALCARPDHRPVRDGFIRMARRIGWSSGVEYAGNTREDVERGGRGWSGGVTVSAK